MRRVRENILVSRGDLGLFPADQEVYSCPTGGAKVTLNVLPGQLVIFDPRTNVSLPVTATPADADRIVIGVGVDTNGDGAADELRRPFGEQIYGSYINAVNSERPRCGVPNIHDLLFKCTDCAVTYTMQINVEDDRSQNQYPYNRPSSYVFSVTTECCDCEDCTSGHAATDLACKMVDTINNGIMGTDPTLISTFKKQVEPDLPFYAVRLFGGTDASQVYCITPNSDSCGNGCTTVAGIKGIRIDLGAGATTYDFNNTLNPADGTTTLTAQLGNVVSEINRLLDGNGSATITSGAGDCCTYQLEINSCATEAVLIDYNDADLTPCSSGNPLDPITSDVNCKNCGAGTENITFESGIRIIAKTVDLQCNCEFPPNPPTGYFGRKLQIFASEGWDCGSTYVRETQAMQLPQNLGYQWQWREYTTDNGGRGRSHNPYNDQYGPISLPGKQDRASSTLVDCKADYCTYVIEHGLPHTNNGVSDPFRTARGRTVVLIPVGDTTTQTEFESAINAYIAAGAMPSRFATVTCASDQDQDAVAATGTLTLTGNAVEDETVTIGSVTYTWKAAPAAANEVDIGGSASASIDNLIAAINLSGTPGTEYGTGTVVHPTVSAAAGAGDTMVLTAKVAGSDGNDIATTETMTLGSFGAATLTGGLDFAVTAPAYPNANGYIV